MPTYSNSCDKAGSHDVGGDDSLVILSPGDLAQIQQVPDHRHQEPVLLLFQHGTTDGANGPAQGVEPIPGQLPPILQLGLHVQRQ